MPVSHRVVSLLLFVVEHLTLNCLTLHNPMVQRRVLLPGCIFPLNLFGKSLPFALSFRATIARPGSTAIVKVSAVVPDGLISSTGADAAASARDPACEGQAAVVGLYTVFRVSGCSFGIALRPDLASDAHFHLH